MRAYYAIRQLANTEKGLPAAAMRQLYTSSVLPILKHGAEVWYRPGGRMRADFKHTQVGPHSTGKGDK